MRKLLFTLTIAFISIITNAQMNPDLVIENFWNNYQNKEATETLNELYKNSPWLERSKDQIEKLKTQFQDLPNLVGQFYGYELLTKKKFGESYLIYIFMVKYDRQPMRFQFDFYKPDTEWRIHSFTYDYDLDDDFEKIAKQESLK